MAESMSSADTAIGRQAACNEEKQKAPVEADNPRNPPSPRVSSAANPFQHRAELEIDDYFTGPRDISKHSKWPMFMRMHGSILPKMILPLLFVGAWSTAVTVISKKVHYLGVDSVLLTITGFVISLGLSFRSSTAYERYAEGRRYWSMLAMASQTLGRVFWIHASDPPDEDVRDVMLRKISGMNMVVAFSVSLKHTLRFEPFTAYADMQSMIGHLNTFAREATTSQPEKASPPRKNLFKETGEYLGISFAASNPRKALKKSDQPLGNLPLEILNHISITVDQMVRSGQLDVPMQQTLAYNNIGILNDVLTGCERVLNTPLPLAYAIAISQITWVYVMLLPFQLIVTLDWIAIPATVAAAYIILGLLLIGAEIENPFGQDVNDLPLELYCEEIANDMDIIAAYEKREPMSFMSRDSNMPLYPASTAPMSAWTQKSEENIREAIKKKPQKMFQMKKPKANDNPASADNMV